MRFVSVVSLLLLLMGTGGPTLAQEARTPPFLPPRLVITQEDGKQGTLGLRKAEVQVSISGPLAQTTMQLTFENTTGRILEGELEFPLPEGATVSGYGLDVDGQIVDGVPVAKQEARVAFEKETRRRVDPGLVEYTVGNNFRTRVYPILPNGTRTVKVQYVTDLISSGPDLTYRVPLRWGQTIPQATVTVDVTERRDFPKLRFGDRENLLQFQKTPAGYTATRTFEQVKFEDDLEVRLPDAAMQTLSVVESFTRPSLGQPENFFVVSDAPPMPLRVARPAQTKANRIALVWDASFSREKADLARERLILRQLLRLLGTVTVDVFVLRDTFEAPRSFTVTNGDGSRVLAFLQTVVNDGGTNLNSIRLPGNGTGYDYAVLFSDGLGNLGAHSEDARPPISNCPMYAVNSDARANHPLLRYLTERSGGFYYNLARYNDNDVVTGIGATAFSLLKVEVVNGRIGDVFPSGRQTVQGRTLVTGRMLSDRATVRLVYGIGDQPTYTKTVTLTPNNAFQTGLPGRYWAQRKADDLGLFPEKNQEWLLSLGRDFNIVTPNTSLLVLETLQQHLEHNITPPKSRPELYAQYQRIQSQRTVQKRSTEGNKLNRVLAMWQERVRWWERDFPVIKRNAKSAVPLRPGMAVYADAPGGNLRGRTAETPGNVGALRVGVDVQVVQATAAVATPRPVAVMADASKAASASSVVLNREEEAEEIVTLSAKVHTTEDSSSDGGRNREAAITIKAWTPTTPYLNEMRKATTNAYPVYLAQRKTYGESPAFFLDCAEFFAQRKQNDVAVRVLTNILELKLDDAQLNRIVAHRLAQWNRRDFALPLFERVTKQRGEEPQSWRDLALVYADRADASATRNPEQAVADYNKALQLLNKVILGEWNRFEQIEDIAVMEANRIIARARRLSPAVTARLVVPLDRRLVKLLDCDMRVVMTWDSNDTDMDLWVNEPSGEKCYYSHPRTATGGHLSRDFTEGYGPEEYFLRRSPDGKFMVRSNYFGSRQQLLTGGTTVQAVVYTNYGRPTENKQTLTLRLTRNQETVEIGSIAYQKDRTKK